MAVRRRRPLIPPPYPRRNRYTPIWASPAARLDGAEYSFGIVTYFPGEVCYNSMKFMS